MRWMGKQKKTSTRQYVIQISHINRADVTYGTAGSLAQHREMFMLAGADARDNLHTRIPVCHRAKGSGADLHGSHAFPPNSDRRSTSALARPLASPAPPLLTLTCSGVCVFVYSRPSMCHACVTGPRGPGADVGLQLTFLP